MNKVLEDLNDHRIEIGIAVMSIVGCAALVVAGSKLSRLNTLVSIQADVILDQSNKIEYLEKLCAIKDAAHLELASDATRRGSSLGAQTLANWRYYLEAA